MSEDASTILQSAILKPEVDKAKSRPFPSSKGIRPIVPLLAPKIPGPSLRPIQPKPTTLPVRDADLFIDKSKQYQRKINTQHLEATSMNTVNKKINVEDETYVIDLSINKVNHTVEKKLSEVFASKIKNDPKQIAKLMNSVPSASYKDNSPGICVKTDFNSRHKQNLAGNTDYIEILKHITKTGANLEITANPAMSSMFSSQL